MLQSINISVCPIGLLPSSVAAACSALTHEGSEMRSAFLHPSPVGRVVAVGRRGAASGPVVAWASVGYWRGYQEVQAFTAEPERRRGWMRTLVAAAVVAGAIEKGRRVAAFDRSCAEALSSHGYLVDVFERSGDGWRPVSETHGPLPACSGDGGAE